MKLHGKAFKKAQIGAVISGGGQTATPKPINYNNLYDQADYALSGQTDQMRQDAAYKQATLAAQQKQSGGGGIGDILGKLGKLAGKTGGGAGAGATDATGGAGAMGDSAGSDIGAVAKKGVKIPKYINGGEGDPYGYNSDYMDVAANPAAASNPANSNNLMSSGAGQSTTNLNASLTKLPGSSNKTSSGGSGFLDAVGKFGGPAGKLTEGFKALEAEKQQVNASNQASQVSGLALQASALRPEIIPRKYNLPQDQIIQPNQLASTYGVGTSILARNGAMLQDGGPVGGNPTEIQNTYGIGNSIYDDLGYEPLSDSEIVKQYRAGGLIPKAQSGFSAFASGGGGDLISQGITGATGKNAGGDIGGTIGGTVGSAFGPAGQMVGQVAGQLIGTALDTNPNKIKNFDEANQRNLTGIAGNQFGKGVQQQYSSNMENGGWMNPEYNPQVIAKFGDHSPEDIYHFAHQGMDSLRAGGHLKSYTAPSEEAMQTYAMGGELQTHWGGGAETISQNPYLPDSGETIMFRGKSHEERSPNGETGIGVTYGNNPVEVERGEPAVKLQDGTGGDSSLVVYGNLQIPKYGVDMLGDPKAKGKKFKNYVADLSKNEAKQNRTINTSTNKLDDLDVRTSADQLKLYGLQANLIGANMNLKNIAEKKQNAAHLQQALNDTAEENGWVADDLAKGKIKIDKEAMKQYAKFGGKFESAQKGKEVKTPINLVPDTNNYTDLPQINLPVVNDYSSSEQAAPESGETWQPLSFRNNNPGNVTDPKTGKIIRFNNPEQGLAATKHQIDLYLNNDSNAYKARGWKGPITPASFIETWTPANALGNSKESTSNYQKHVAKTLGIGVNDPIPNTPESRAKLLQAIGQFESGVPDWYSPLNYSNQPTNVSGMSTNTSETPVSYENMPNVKPFGRSDWSSDVVEPSYIPLQSKPAGYVDLYAANKQSYGMIDQTIPNAVSLAGRNTSGYTPTTKEKEAKLPWWKGYGDALLQQIRPTYKIQQPDLTPEMMAMGMNQQEPVAAQSYQPQLASPYDISLQDQIVSIDSQARAAIKAAGNNPAAQAQIMAQANDSKNKVLGEQFRLNQGQKAQTYGKNLDLLNDAQLKNLSMYDQQYTRQAQAKSNTKQQAIEIAKSVSDKINKAKQEQILANIELKRSNYYVDPTTGAATYIGPSTQFNQYGNTQAGNSGLSEYERAKAITKVYEDKMKEREKEIASKIKIRNGSIVKALKNL